MNPGPPPSEEAKDLPDLFQAVYSDLRRLAAARMSQEPGEHTLQPTALVHEAWLKLAATAPSGRTFQGKGHFLLVASQAMRQILIDHARRKLSAKRGAGRTKVDLDALETVAQADAGTLIAVGDALQKLALEDEQAAQLIQLRFFGGMGYSEAAEALGISERTAKRSWTFARAWLFRELRGVSLDP